MHKRYEQLVLMGTNLILKVRHVFSRDVISTIMNQLWRIISRPSFWFLSPFL